MSKRSPKDWFERKIASLISKDSVEPPADTWDDIANQLDLEEVWEGVHNQLDQMDQFRFWRKARYTLYAAAAIALLILLPWPLNHQEYWKWSTSENNPQLLVQDTLQEQEEDTGRTENATQKAIPALAQSEQKNNTSKAEREKETVKPLAPQRQKLAESPQDVVKKPAATPVRGKVKAESQLASLNLRKKKQLTAGVLALHKPAVPASGNHDYGSELPGKLFLGVNGMFSNTWLLNDKTYAGFQPKKLISTQVNYEHSFAMMAGYQLTPKISLRTELAYQQNIGQTYYEYINGNYVRRDINLRYLHSSMLTGYSKKARPLAGIKARTVLIGGLYYNYLRTARERLADETNNIKTQYRNSDLGLIVGVDEQLMLNKYLRISAGIRANYGLWNVFEGDGYIPGYLNNTNIASFNFVLGLQVHPFKQD